MKIAKTLRITGIVLLVLIIVLIVAFNLFGTKAIKIGIEAGASQALNVPVAVEDVNLSVLAGKAGIKNLIIDNPPGYQNAKLLELGRAQVDLDVGSVLGDTITIDDILLEKVNVILEQKGLTNNIQEVLDGMPRQPDQPKVEEDQPTEKPAKKLLIKNLQINEVAVKVKLLPLLGKKDTFELKLSPITMTDLGSDERVDLAVLAGKILRAIAEGIAKEGAGVLPDEITGPMADTLKEYGAAAQAALEKTEKLLKEPEKVLKETERLLEDTGKVGEELQKGLGGLLKRKEKK